MFKLIGNRGRITRIKEEMMEGNNGTDLILYIKLYNLKLLVIILYLPGFHRVNVSTDFWVRHMVMPKVRHLTISIIIKYMVIFKEEDNKGGLELYQ